MHMKLLDPENLARGTETQQKAYQALKNLKIFETLKDHSPVLAGTIPLDVDIPGSDLDVICSTENLESFAQTLVREFGSFSGFALKHTIVRSEPTVIARFEAEGFPIEIFAQSSSVFTQPAVVHMLIEARLLTFAPREAREMIRALKQSGIKTEPAFAQCFEIEGDPYEELLKISRLPDHEILNLTHRFRFRPQ
jgi:hypothetical protein